MSTPYEQENCLSPKQWAQVERISQQRQRLRNEWIYLEESPRFDEHEQPTPIHARRGPGWCGDPFCRYRHGVFAAHETVETRDHASTADRDEIGSNRRYHVDIWIRDSWIVDARPICELLSVAALQAQEPAALAALRVLRNANVGLVYISEAAAAQDAKLLIFSEEFGPRIQIVEARVVSRQTSRAADGSRRLDAGHWRRVVLHRLHRTSLRAKVGTLCFEAVLVYGCGELAAWLLGDGSRLASDRITLPVWLVAIPLILLSSAVKWLVWRRLRPTVRLTSRRLATIRDRMTSRASSWIADLDEESQQRAQEQPPNLGRPWQQQSTRVQQQPRRRAPAQSMDR
ncbi:MAG: hypothetical protein WBQ21_10760 [Solirubrobacteraceae bacterium]